MSINDTLKTIDDQITKATGSGEPGSGLYSLLSTLASQFLGVPRAPPPTPPADAPPSANTPPESEHVEPSTKHKKPA